MRIVASRPDLSPAGLAALAAEWRALEAVSDASPFQSWTWVGRLASRRYPDPLLLRADDAGKVVGLALANRAGPLGWRRLYLHETGAAVADSVFIEHNGPLLARGHGHLLAPMLRAGLDRAAAWRLSGVGDDVLVAARESGVCRLEQTRPAPFAIPSRHWFDRLGAATRAQIRRTRNRYAAAGPLVLHRPGSLDEALAMLDRLIVLHQTSWRARGQAGAFAAADVIGFHRALIHEGWPRGEIDLLHLRAGTVTVGYLYNLRWREKVYAYQSGFDYDAARTAGANVSPGLLCHATAVADLVDRAEIYDFLAGAARYKTSLASGSRDLHWLSLLRPGTPRALMARARSYGEHLQHLPTFVKIRRFLLRNEEPASRGDRAAASAERPR